MIDWVHILVIPLAAFRLTELVTMDRITAPVRAWWPSFVVTCGRCVSVWMAGVAVGLYLTLPWVNWVLAIAWLYLVQIDARHVAISPGAPVSPEAFVGTLVLENLALKERLVHGGRP